MRRPKGIGLVLAVIAVCLAVCASTVLAEGKRERKKATGPKKYRITGTVKATKNDDGDITAVTITTAKGTPYGVNLDEGKGSDLGKDMDGKKAIAIGTISKRDGKRIVTVASYKEWTPRRKKPKKPDKPNDEQ